jgi:hypothetical protein
MPVRTASRCNGRAKSVATFSNAVTGADSGLSNVKFSLTSNRSGEKMTNHENQRPRLSVIETGYLGATHAICMASLGYEVIGVDVDAHKIDELRQGRVPSSSLDCRSWSPRPWRPVA